MADCLAAVSQVHTPQLFGCSTPGITVVLAKVVAIPERSEKIWHGRIVSLRIRER